MKRFTSVLLALALAAAFTGCWGDNNTSSGPNPTATPCPQSSAASTLPGSSNSSSASAGSSASDPLTDPGTTSGAASGSSAMTSRAAAAAAAPDSADWALRLVNETHPLPIDFRPDTRPVHGNREQQFDRRAAEDLEALLEAAHREGKPLQLVSTYRTADEQTALFESRVQELTQQGLTRAQAEIAAEAQTARPGRSEHQLGLAADFSAQDDHFVEDFEATSSFQWLKDRAQDYGFILRYPNGSQPVTGVESTPVHWRYVGRDAAAEIHATGSTLEEYRQQKGFTG